MDTKLRTVVLGLSFTAGIGGCGKDDGAESNSTVDSWLEGLEDLGQRFCVCEAEEYGYDPATYCIDYTAYLGELISCIAGVANKIPEFEAFLQCEIVAVENYRACLQPLSCAELRSETSPAYTDCAMAYSEAYQACGSVPAAAELELQACYYSNYGGEYTSSAPQRSTRRKVAIPARPMALRWQG